MSDWNGMFLLAVPLEAINPRIFLFAVITLKLHDMMASVSMKSLTMITLIINLLDTFNTFSKLSTQFSFKWLECAGHATRHMWKPENIV